MIIEPKIYLYHHYLMMRKREVPINIENKNHISL